MISDPYDDSKVEIYLKSDPDILSYEKSSDTLYKARVQVSDSPELQPVDVVLTIGANVEMLLIAVVVDGDQLAAAIGVTARIGVVGLCSLGSGFALRYSVFKQHSDMLALVNGLQALALAYNFYLDAVQQGG